MRRAWWLALALTGCKAWLDIPPPGQVFRVLGFEDATERLGYAHVGPTYGMGWGDPNGDGLLDLWSGNHAGPPTLHLNRGDGTFAETYATGWLDPLDGAWADQTYDAHGTLWVDLDGDGDEDLIESVGAQRGEGLGGTIVHLNEGGRFLRAPDDLGLTHTNASGRCPVPYDANGDGLTDILMVAQPKVDGTFPSALFLRQPSGGFVQSFETPADIAVPTALCGQLADLDGDDQAELLSFGRPGHLLAQRGNGEALIDVTAELGVPQPLYPYDVVVGDFDNDLSNDLFVTRFSEKSDVDLRPDAGRLALSLRLNGGSVQGVRFRGGGTLTISLDPPTFWEADVFKVGSGCSVRAVPSPTLFQVTFTAEDADVAGRCAITPGTSTGLYVGLQDGVWSVLLATAEYNRGNVIIQGTEPMTEVVQDGIDRLSEADATQFNRDRLYLWREGAFVDEGWPRGIQQLTSCTSAVAGDFDNDMDLDLFLACATPVSNTADLLYRNDDGVFSLIAEHGAEGATAGRADSVAMADYDEDGFLDLAVSNGYAAAPFNAGPLQLFHNIGNGNHWIELDLEGTTSTREAWGAVVIARTGAVSQRREVSAGTHATAQNARRLHFGLGAFTTIDELEIRWPSGRVEILSGVEVDQRLRVVEGG